MTLDVPLEILKLVLIPLEILLLKISVKAILILELVGVERFPRLEGVEFTLDEFQLLLVHSPIDLKHVADERRQLSLMREFPEILPAQKGEDDAADKVAVAIAGQPEGLSQVVEHVDLLLVSGQPFLARG